MKSVRVQSPPMLLLPPPPPPPPPAAVEDLLPPEKKQKVDKEEEDDHDDNASWSSFGSGTEIITDWKDEEISCVHYSSSEEEDEAVWDKYLQQIEDSDGFDIEDYPGGCMATIYPMPLYLNNPKNHDMLKGYAERAIEKHNNEKGTDYEVVKVLKVNGGGCQYWDWYLTFSVVTRNGKKDVFQAKVVEDIDDNLEFPIIRSKPKSK